MILIGLLIIIIMVVIVFVIIDIIDIIEIIVIFPQKPQKFEASREVVAKKKTFTCKYLLVYKVVGSQFTNTNI